MLYTSRFCQLFIGVSLLFSCVQDPNKLKISIEWELNGNQIKGQNKFASTFYLSNLGTVALDDKNWSLYYSMTPRGLVKDSFKGQVTFNHVNGDLFVIRPDSGFLLAPGEKIAMSFEGRDFIIKQSDRPAGLYFLMNDGVIYEPNYTFRSFKNPEMITKGSADYYEIPTAESIYNQNKRIKSDDQEDLSKLVPTPLEEVYFDGFVSLDQSWSIEASPLLGSESNFFTSAIDGIFWRKSEAGCRAKNYFETK